jgi:selenocysteine lyase/cysteine desulfurase
VDIPPSIFEAEPGYLNTASLGVPPAASVERMSEILGRWRRGRLSPPEFDADIARARAAWAAISRVPIETVAIGASVSEFVGVIAAALPDGARVVIPRGEFTSLLFPFLVHADRGVTVDEVALEELPHLRGRADLVAVSAVQSANGRLADLDAIAVAAGAAGARLLVDTTQSCGWLPLDCSRFDYAVCGAYKWLLSPRGTAFMSVSAEAAGGLRPLAAGWYAGDEPWQSVYGTPLRLARDARRFDTSPAWFSWAGAVPSLELLAGLDAAAIHAHNVALADAFLSRLGEAPQASAIATVDRPGAAAALEAAGVRAAVRAGRVRVSFHLYNTDADVELAVAALTT